VARANTKRRRPARSTAAKPIRRTRRPTKPAPRSRATAKPTRSGRRPSHGAPRRRALTALNEMRGGKSLTKAAKRAKTTRGTVRKYAKSAVVRTTRGRYKPRGYDRLTREMRFLTADGVLALPVRSSASASRIGEYFNAVNRYLKTGRADSLRAFRGKSVKVKGVTHKFVIDPLALDRLAMAGEVFFEDLYPITA
jgi:hypothetical protein